MRKNQKNFSYYLTPALLLDLDGTVRLTKTGQAFPENIHDQIIRPGIEEIIWKYREIGFSILGISNQGGVAHGYKTRPQVDMEAEITMQSFGRNPFHYIYHAFCDIKGTVAPYNIRSLLRKPNIGMLAIAEAQLFEEGFVTDWDSSLFVGDRPEDQECASNAGITFLHIDDFMKADHAQLAIELMAKSETKIRTNKTFNQ